MGNVSPSGERSLFIQGPVTFTTRLVSKIPYLVFIPETFPDLVKIFSIGVKVWIVAPFRLASFAKAYVVPVQ